MWLKDVSFATHLSNGGQSPLIEIRTKSAYKLEKRKYNQTIKSRKI